MKLLTNKSKRFFRGKFLFSQYIYLIFVEYVENKRGKLGWIAKRKELFINLLELLRIEETRALSLQPF